MGGDGLVFLFEFCFQSQAPGRWMSDRGKIESQKHGVYFTPLNPLPSPASLPLESQLFIFSYPPPSLDDPELGRKWEETTREA